MRKFLSAKTVRNVYDNTLDAFVPEHWANESLAILEENMVMANLVHRDFEPIIANFGDVVNTRKPGEFQALRKTAADSVTVQDASATNVQVVLNQHIHTAFLIKDGEESLSFKNLVDEFMAPSMLAQARMVDQILLGQVYQFMGNVYGQSGGLSSANAIDYVTGVRNVMNVNKAYVTNRNLVLTPNSETILLRDNYFTAANLIGDDGTALREASLGRKFGFDLFMCQNTPSVATTATATTSGAINAGNVAAGSTVLTIDGVTGIIATGTWLLIKTSGAFTGDFIPHRVTAHSETLGNTVSITVTPALPIAITDNAPITFFTPGTVNFASGYAIGYSKAIKYAGSGFTPKPGQVVSFGLAAGGIYTVTSVDTVNSTITLDRPLEEALTNTEPINPGPSGEFNFAFHKNALALVCRPLAAPRAGTGALASVVNVNGLSMRAVISYDGRAQGHLVVLDCLLGVKVLDVALGAVMLG